MEFTGTYSPDDNKLRLYASSRLDAETYARVKAAGFKWAPKQDLFFAPMWTPDREDLLIELCGDVGDEDKSLIERQEERAERFDDYSDKREADAERARQGVAAIAGNIPFGQPILIGHHSERHARRDAKRIDDGMRKAVKMWETSEYWTRRAASALRHAKYKELPSVRARRIKGIEADLRKTTKHQVEANRLLSVYQDPDARTHTLSDGRSFIRALLESYGGGLSYERQRELAKDEITLESALDTASKGQSTYAAHCQRWVDHYNNRLAYERAMLEEQGASDLLKPKARPAQLPLCNYRVPDGLDIANIYHKGETIHYPQVEMTKAEYAKIYNDYKGTRPVENSHRVRTAMIRSSEARLSNPNGLGAHGLKLVCVFLTDSKAHTKPGAIEPEPPTPRAPRPTYQAPKADPQAAPFVAMKEQLQNGGVAVVVAPQLFPTPPDVAARMVDLAGVEIGMRVLEPSAGTGRILEALPGVLPFSGPGRQTALHVVAVEINLSLAERLNSSGLAQTVICSDFLDMYTDESAKFDRVLMNPPFENGADIKHIRHAVSMLKPGGRLVAICANGPRQVEQLRPLVEQRGGTWEPLPADTFKTAGTRVNTVLLSINA